MPLLLVNLKDLPQSVAEYVKDDGHSRDQGCCRDGHVFFGSQVGFVPVLQGGSVDRTGGHCNRLKLLLLAVGDAG